jgi:broad specificity phosphatase PhoE
VEIFLVRHGETEWSRARRHTGRTDLPLSPVGEAEAKALGRHLRGLEVDRVLSSPLTRAVTTARASARSTRCTRGPSRPARRCRAASSHTRPPPTGFEAGCCAATDDTPVA